MILHRCSKLEDYVQAFKDAVLPAAAVLRAISEGSVCFTVHLENKSALEVLWGQYQDGTLQRNLQQFLVTGEIRQLADGEEVTVSVYIDEQELKNASLNMSTVQTQGDQLILRAFPQSHRKGTVTLRERDLKIKRWVSLSPSYNVLSHPCSLLVAATYMCMCTCTQ